MSKLGTGWSGVLWMGRLRKAVLIVNIVILCRVRAVGKEKKSGRDGGGKEGFGIWEELKEPPMQSAYLLGMLALF